MIRACAGRLERLRRMKLAPLVALLSLSALALVGCDDLDETAGVGAQKGVYGGPVDTPLSEETRKALSKRSAHQNYGL
jgi:hypothetical protein